LCIRKNRREEGKEREEKTYKSPFVCFVFGGKSLIKRRSRNLEIVGCKNNIGEK